MTEPKLQASKGSENRRQDSLTPGPYEDNLTPAERLAEHKASLAVRPAGFRVRVNLRYKMDGNEAPLVRKMYDLANEAPKRRRRRRKETK